VEAFRDHRVTLEQLLAFADNHAPAVATAQQRLRLGDAEVEAASPLLAENPEVTGALGFRTTDGGSGVDFEVGASQAIPISGERAARIRAAQATRRALAADLECERWRVHQQIRREYRLALVDREQRKLADAALEYAERLHIIAERRLQAGEISPMPVLLAESEVARARDRQIAAADALDERRMRLAALSGWPVSAEPPDPVGPLPTSEQLPPLRDVLSAARNRHRQRAALTARVEAKEAAIVAADRGAWPSPSVGAGFAQEAEPGASRPARIWRVRVSVPLPLWQRNRGERARTLAAARLAHAELTAYDRMLEVELRALHQQARAAARRLRVYGELALPKLSESLSLSQRAFEVGETSLLDVLAAGGRLLGTRQKALSVRAEYAELIAALELAAGTELSTVARSRTPRASVSPASDEAGEMSQ
jgi:cobalt-zinc-cadmium efflux system outer membrane protein